MSEKKNKKTMEKLIIEGFIKTCRIGDTGKVEIQIDPVSPYTVEYQGNCYLLAVVSLEHQKENDGSLNAKLLPSEGLFEWKCDNLKPEVLSICVTLKTAHARCRFTLQEKEKCIVEVEIL